MRRRPIAALLVAALLAAPAGAFAQSAGDEQYSDPFGDVEDPSQENGGSNGSSGPDTDTTVAAPAEGAADAATADSSGSTLPRTGFPAALAAMLGALLLVMGASVWRRAQPPLALPLWLTPASSRSVLFGARRRRRR